MRPVKVLVKFIPAFTENAYLLQSEPGTTPDVYKRQHYYSVGGNNLMLAIKNAEEADPVNHNAIAQCKIQ